MVIDTLQKVKPQGKRNQNAYENDVGAMKAVTRLALTHHVAVILIHHLRKGDADDVFDEVSGSLGITGSADTNIVMRADRDKRTAVMHITGRAIKEYQALAMKFDKDTARWTVEGTAAEVSLGENRKAIREVVLEAGKALTIKEIKNGLELKGLSLKDANLKKTVGRMVTDDQLAKVGDDRYSIETGYKVASVSTTVSPPNTTTQILDNNSSTSTVLGVRDDFSVLAVRGVLPPLTTSIKDRSDSRVSYPVPAIFLNKIRGFAFDKTGKTGRTPVVQPVPPSVTDEHRATCKAIKAVLRGY